jgi:hypothetical protein
MNSLVLSCVAALVLIVPGSQFVYAHPGGLDKNGGHVDKSTGVYHCHRAACSAGSATRVERRTAPVEVTFKRNEWGNWKDADNDCQDTRAEVLQRDSSVAVTFAGNKTCAVATGQWHDPYTGDQFTRALSLDIDHIVPLEWANNHGGAKWTTQQKQGFTNELENLITVGAGVNRDKGAQGPDKWLPPEANFHCGYLSRFLQIYKSHSLQFLAAEKQAITPLAVSCDLTL